MLKGELIDILLYCFNISLIDVRCDIIQLFKEITNPIYKDLANLRLFEEKVIPILKECILPNYLNVVRKLKQDTFIKSNCLSFNSTSPNAKLASTMPRISSDKLSLIDTETKNNLKGLNRVFDEKPQNINFNTLDKEENSKDLIENRDSYYLQIEEDEKENNLQDKELKLNKLVKSQSEISQSSKKSDENINIKPFRIIKPVSGFSSRIKKQRISPEKTVKINLDTDSINSGYKFGGERGEKNITDEESFKELEKKVKSLAKHCVEIIIGEKQECDKEEQNYFDNEEEKNIIPKYPTHFQPRSVRSLQTINYKNFNINFNNGNLSINLDLVIEEDPGGENSSPDINTKRSKNSKVSTLCNLENQISMNSQKSNNLTEEMKPEIQEIKVIQTAMLQRSSSEKKSLKSLTTYYDDKNYENLENYFDKETYEKYTNALYTSLFEWLLNIKDSNTQDENQYDFKDIIANEYIIEIFIKFCNFHNVNLIQRFMSEIHRLISNNRGIF